MMWSKLQSSNYRVIGCISRHSCRASEQNETSMDEKGKQVPTVKATLGAKAQEALIQGSEVAEETIAALVAEAIRTLNAKISEDPRVGGWILVDYPKTKSQAQALERELSGYVSHKAQGINHFMYHRYEDTKPPKLGNLKRPAAKDAAKEKKNKSLIARPPSQGHDVVAAPESIIDAILFLEVTNDMAIRRAVGRRVDPITGKIYHVEFNPPPADEPVGV